jgi:signal transduction histidine kinase
MASGFFGFTARLERLEALRPVAFWAMVTTLAVVAVVYFVASLSWFDRPYPGFKVRIDQAVEFQLPPYSTGSQAGLMPGDRVLTFDGHALSDTRALYAYVAERPIGTPVTYTLQRNLPDGRRVHLTKVIATQIHDARHWVSMFLALWLTGVCFLALGTAVSVLKPGDALARASLAFHMTGAAAAISIFDQSTTFLTPTGDPARILHWIVGMAFTNLALHFPRRYAGLTGLRRLNLVGGTVVGAVLVVGYYLGHYSVWITFAHLAYLTVGEGLFLANSLWAWRGPASTPRERGQGKAILVGTLVSTAPALLVPQAHLLGLHVDLVGLENLAFPIWVLVVTYAIIRHQLFDIRPIVRRSLTYLLAAAVLTGLYVLATTVTEALVGSQTRVPGIVGTVLVAFAFAPVRDRVKAWLDARFFRSPYRVDEVIATFTRTAQETLEPRALVQAYRDVLDGALAPTRVVIALDRDGPHDEPPQRADEPLRRLPLAAQGHALGHVLVGAKKSGLAYSELDDALLRELTQLLAVWLHVYDRFEKARLQTQEIEALKRSEAMQGQFLNIVSHELKIPLSVIKSSLSILKRTEADQDAKTVSHLNRIGRSMTHLVSLVGDLLNASQLQSGHFQLRTRPMAIDRVAKDTLAEMRPLAENKGHRLTMDIAPALPSIPGDEMRLAQVVRNLLHNAIRYTPANGRIHLIIRAEGRDVRCEVQDNGPGIEAAAERHLFQRFSQVHAESPDRDQGVGLGLFISKAIVEAHGGHIGVESRPGEGATFWFTLPVSVERDDAERLPVATGSC